MTRIELIKACDEVRNELSKLATEENTPHFLRHITLSTIGNLMLLENLMRNKLLSDSDSDTVPKPMESDGVETNGS